MTAAGFSDSASHGHDALRRTNSGEDREFDAEVARFLETELFTSESNSLADVSTPQPSADKACVIPVNEDLVFMDFIESIEMPDLECEHDRELPSEDVQMSDDSVSSSSHERTTTTTVTATPDILATSSLHLVIPASVLAASTPTKKPTIRRRRGSVKKIAPPRPKVKKERKRVKDEIEYLRQQVKALEVKLNELQYDSVEEAAPEVPLVSFGEGQILETKSQSTAWESIAKRQEFEKQKSKVENLQLRQMVKNQLGLAKGLSNLLQSQQDIAWLEIPPSGRAMKRLCNVSDHDESTFEMLAAQVEAMHNEVDAALSDLRRTGPEPGVKSDADGDVSIEFADRSVLPFEFRTTANAVWKLMSTSSLNFGSRQYQAISATDDTVRAKLSVTIRMRQYETRIEMSFFGKRFIDADRVVIVWSAVGEAKGCINRKERVQVRERGWVLIRAADTFSEANHSQQHSGTIIQSIARLTPELRATKACSDASEDLVGLLTDVVLSLYHQNFGVLRQMIENTILSDASGP